MVSLVDLRGAEFNLVKHFFHPGLRALEIGGGNGFQASLIAALGANVESIDIVEQPVDAVVIFPLVCTTAASSLSQIIFLIVCFFQRA